MRPAHGGETQGAMPPGSVTIPARAWPKTPSTTSPPSSWWGSTRPPSEYTDTDSGLAGGMASDHGEPSGTGTSDRESRLGHEAVNTWTPAPRPTKRNRTTPGMLSLLLMALMGTTGGMKVNSVPNNSMRVDSDASPSSPLRVYDELPTSQVEYEEIMEAMATADEAPNPQDAPLYVHETPLPYNGDPELQDAALRHGHTPMLAENLRRCTNFGMMRHSTSTPSRPPDVVYTPERLGDAVRHETAPAVHGPSGAAGSGSADGAVLRGLRNTAQRALPVNSICGCVCGHRRDPQLRAVFVCTTCRCKVGKCCARATPTYRRLCCGCCHTGHPPGTDMVPSPSTSRSRSRTPRDHTPTTSPSRSFPRSPREPVQTDTDRPPPARNIRSGGGQGE